MVIGSVAMVTGLVAMAVCIIAIVIAMAIVSVVKVTGTVTGLINVERHDANRTIRRLAHYGLHLK